MGQIFSEITLSNPANAGLSPISINALVDTGALFLCIPAHVAIQLQLTEYEMREVTIADGSRKLVPYAGPLKINCKNRMCITGALIMGETALLGAIPIEDMDLVIHPAQLKLTVNPENPNIAKSLVTSHTR